MPRTARIEKKGYYNHIICRGQRKNPLFFSNDDMNEYYKIVNYSLSKTDSIISAYCLMRNHIHLLVKRNKIPLYRLMHRINTIYSLYFNRKYKLSGHVFQGRYKSFIVLEEKHLYTVVNYIHNNPVKAGLVKKCIKYKHSSAKAYQKGSSDININLVNINTTFYDDIEKMYNNQYEYIGNYDKFLKIEKRMKNRENAKNAEKRVVRKQLFKNILIGILCKYDIDYNMFNNRKWFRNNIKIRKLIIIDILNSGFSQSEIARFLNCSKQLISKIMKNN